jgi:hypothetical protein
MPETRIDRKLRIQKERLARKLKRSAENPQQMHFEIVKRKIKNV